MPVKKGGTLMQETTPSSQHDIHDAHRSIDSGQQDGDGNELSTGRALAIQRLALDAILPYLRQRQNADAIQSKGTSGIEDHTRTQENDQVCCNLELIFNST
mmetsp:Transcript_37071/g.96082  ORF Transcript_37071/g.96082 Transcript_37071/m.96082 type:complete len:101 (-) Transcript_37071:3527-3829(-)